MRLVEVRCCCDAHLIGYVPVPHEPEEGRRYVFALGRIPIDDDGPFETVAFEWCPIQRRPFGPLTFAMKSNDYPLAQLRRIMGFRTATAEEREAAR